MKSVEMPRNLVDAQIVVTRKKGWKTLPFILQIQCQQSLRVKGKRKRITEHYVHCEFFRTTSFIIVIPLRTFVQRLEHTPIGIVQLELKEKPCQEPYYLTPLPIAECVERL
jgi:hypothetical protein